MSNENQNLIATAIKFLGLCIVMGSGLVGSSIAESGGIQFLCIIAVVVALVEMGNLTGRNWYGPKKTAKDSEATGNPE